MRSDRRRARQEARSRGARADRPGPFQPVDALRVGLIDEVAYEDELDDLVPTQLQGADYIDAEDYARRCRGSGPACAAASKIAVINAVGRDQRPARAASIRSTAPVVGSDSLVEYIREARADALDQGDRAARRQPGRLVVGVGRDLARAARSRARTTRPLIVSMSDLAASGGYYIALAGDAIVAQPGTLTGSIGVYTGKFVIAGTLEKLGREHRRRRARGKHAEIYSPDRAIHAGRARARSRNRCRSSTTSSSRTRRRGAAHDAGEGRRDRAGPRLDRRAGAG